MHSSNSLTHQQQQQPQQHTHTSSPLASQRSRRHLPCHECSPGVERSLLEGRLEQAAVPVQQEASRDLCTTTPHATATSAPPACCLADVCPSVCLTGLDGVEDVGEDGQELLQRRLGVADLPQNRSEDASHEGRTKPPPPSLLLQEPLLPSLTRTSCVTSRASVRAMMPEPNRSSIFTFECAYTMPRVTTTTAPLATSARRALRSGDRGGVNG